MLFRSETRDLMVQKRFPEVMARVARRLEAEPDQPGMNALMGHCLSNLSRHDEAIPYFRKASEVDPERRASWGVWVCVALQKTGHSAEALPLLGTAIKPVIDRVMPLWEAEAAHTILEGRQAFGKLVLSVS